MDNYQEPIENTDGNYISMSIEELPYERKDEDAYLKFPGDDDNLENIPVFIAAASKTLTKKHQKSKSRLKNRLKSRLKSRTKSRSKSRRSKKN